MAHCGESPNVECEATSEALGRFSCLKLAKDGGFLMGAPCRGVARGMHSRRALYEQKAPGRS
jgi:hypothetical protein